MRGVDQNIALHVSPAAMNFAFLISAFLLQISFFSFFFSPTSSFKHRVMCNINTESEFYF